MKLTQQEIDEAIRQARAARSAYIGDLLAAAWDQIGIWFYVAGHIVRGTASAGWGVVNALRSDRRGKASS